MGLQPEQPHAFGLFAVTADCGQFGKVQTHSVPQCVAVAGSKVRLKRARERGLSAELSINQRCVVIMFLLTVLFAEHAKLLNLLETL